MTDYAVGDTLYHKFTTRSFTTGAPTTLSGTPVVSIYEDDSVTEITAGITLTVDFDSRTGANHLTVVATGANGYEAGKFYQCMITTGTVGGVSVVSEMVWTFTLNASAAAVDLANGTDGLGAIKGDTAAILVDTGTTLPALLPAALVGGRIDANVGAVSGDATAADNMEATYDGTGYTDIFAPAQQQQVDNISTSSGTANVIATGFVLTTGSEGATTFANTDQRDSVYHTLTDTAGTIDGYYELTLQGNQTPASVTIFGQAQGANDPIQVSQWNWGTSQWNIRGTIPGTGGAADVEYQFALLAALVGTGANIGKMRIRVAGTGLTSATFNVDEFILGYTANVSSVGYANGSIWIDTVGGTAGTVINVNGVADNASLTLADANTIDDTLLLDRFELSPDTSITFVIDQENQVFSGRASTIALGGVALTGSFIVGANVSGTATTSGDQIHFVDCEMETCTLGKSHLDTCGLTGTITLSEATTYIFQTCHSEIAGNGAPIIDFNGGVGDSSLNMRRYSGGIEIQNMGTLGTDTMTLEGDGALIVNANCAGGTIVVRGNFVVTDNSGGSVTITFDDDTTDIKAILVDTGTTIPTVLGTPAGASMSADIADIPTVAEFEVRTPTAAQLAYITANAATAVPVTFTTSGGTTTAAVLNLVDGGGASATDDQYNGRLLVFTNGTLEDVVTDITDYDGTTKVATITAIPFAPTASHTARLV